MEVHPTQLDGVKIVRSRMFGDDRGWFAEVFNRRVFAEAGLPHEFKQDNQSFSRKGVLRGLHYQLGQPQGKLVRVLSGEIWDVAVDIRPDSAQFGKWTAFHLQASLDTGSFEMLWIPEGYAHGFLVLSDAAEVLYKTTDFYFPAGERTIAWNDPELGIAWPLERIPGGAPCLSDKDAAGKLLKEAELTISAFERMAR